ncbi:MAG: deoxynucleoside kinase [Mariprofundaceae bacterium]
MVRRSIEHKHIAIEGAIGVGKTTVAEKLAERLGASLLLEQVDDNPFIELFYQNPERHALSVQLSFLFSRLKQWQGVHQQDLFSQGVILSDYLFAKDRLFATINLSDEELSLYDQVARLVAVNIPKPDLVVYLQSDADVIMNRIRKRNRRMERGLTETYLKQVIAAYDHLFFHYQDTPLLIVQTDRINFAEKPEAIDALINRMSTVRAGTEFWAEFV